MSLLEKVLKKSKTAEQAGFRYFISGENNRIEIIENGKTTLLPAEEVIEGLTIRMTGSNNVIKLYKPFKFINSYIGFDCKNACLEIRENSVCNTLKILNNVGFENRNCYIGKNFACWGCEILLNGRNNSCYIGDDCMFSKEIHVMTGDGHSIRIEGEMPKPLKDIKIGNGVWIGMGAWILKNVNIEDGCVVGAASVLTKSFDKKNCAVAGNPARIIRTNVFWKK